MTDVAESLWPSCTMHAIISDIHGNLEALDAVLADAQACGATDIYCLGDIVGYGPDPIACVQRAMSWPVVLMGNFDQAAISNSDLDGWTALAAKKTIMQFRRSLKQQKLEASVGAFLLDLPRTFSDAEAFYVHGTPRDPVYEYLFPEEIYVPEKMDDIAEGFDRLCFCGHTHLPGIFFRDQAGKWNYMTPEECDHQYVVGEGKTICNVGSVGQPRDADPRSSYVLLDDGKITFRRVDYDIDQTITKIKGDDDFHDFLGDRLHEGR